MLINSKEKILELKTKNTTDCDLSNTEEIEEVKEIQGILKRYLEENTGKAVGIAAPQLEINKNIFLMKLKNGDIHTCINPFFSENKNLVFSAEGCMSLQFNGNIECIVPRYNNISATYYSFNHKGELKKYHKSLSKEEAYVFQHEMDHLVGTLILDKAFPYPIIEVAKDLKYKEVRRYMLKDEFIQKTEAGDIIQDQIMVDYFIDGDDTSLYLKKTKEDFNEENQLVGISVTE